MSVLHIKDGTGFVDIPTINGLSAYQVAVKNGFIGTEEQWLASLVASIPTMSLTTKGGAKVGNNLSITGEVLNVTGVVTTETDPTVPSWAKTASKPAYSKSEVGLGNVDNTSDANKPVSSATQTALNLKVNSSLLGAASGVATLGSNGIVPSSQLPASSGGNAEGYLYNGAFYLELAHTTLIPGVSGKLYIDLTSGVNKLYRWDGSVYNIVSDGVSVGESSGSAYDGLKGKTTTDNLSSHIGSGGSSHSDATTSSSGYMSSTNVTKLNGIDVGANNYSLDNTKLSTVLSGASSDVVTDSDTIPFTDVSASNSTKKQTWAVIKSTLKTYFDTLYNKYVLPESSATTLGGVKVNGTNTTLVSQVLTISDATTVLSGLESASDKTKLNGIENNANNYSLDNSKLSTVLFGAGALSDMSDGDTVPFIAAAETNVTKKISWSSIKDLLKSHFDDIYVSKPKAITIVDAATLVVVIEPETPTKIQTLNLCTSLTISLADGNWWNEYRLIFVTGATPPTITFPAGIEWANGAPTFVANKKYEISVLDGFWRV